MSAATQTAAILFGASAVRPFCSACALIKLHASYLGAAVISSFVGQPNRLWWIFIDGMLRMVPLF
jgi:hypothetical protein